MMFRVLGKLGEESFNTNEEKAVVRPESVQDSEEELARF